ncbi:transcription initiation factor TFIID subunit 7-like [Drosophila innubila]|uniref:transcription initiation factor TFIID subunit 7-like n=1 Tax=Drosophila innubila TaxID=198719 RepID=UPI00148E2F9C|nr:transcription initiation factor TFIID subunit 7-like [Drosophila innubila]
MSENENLTEDNENLELEEQFLMRFPKDLAEAVLESVEAGNINEKLTIELDSELRYGEVRLNDQVLHAKLVDLPTVVESYKTADNINLYKTANISQMLVCSVEPIEEPKNEGKELEKLLYSALKDDKENKSLSKDANKDIPKVDEKFLWPHGLTPPTRNIRRRRIANALKGKNVEPAEQDILKEVKYLLRMDSEAVRVQYEVLDDDGKLDELSDAEGSDDNIEENVKI